MSLLDQLASISQATRGIALDRKKRSKLHSVSFIHDAQYAATQDYESIFADSLEALDRLESLDRRFGKFKNTIFSETSVNIDRQVQSKEENENLDKTINAFLSLLSPYWNLAISAKAAEWPLRRFNLNIYNSEYLLLTTLPYFDQPIFPRVLYVISKFPTMFSWLVNFKKSNKSPSRNSIIKAFTDVDFFNLYSKFVNDELSHNNQYRKQLVFYVSMIISSLAALSSATSNKLPDLVSFSLESVSSLLASNNEEAKVSGYTILAVLSSAVPLSKDVILASIDTILLSASGEGNDLSSHAFRCILKLYQSIQSGGLEALPLNTLNKLPSGLFNKDFEFLDIIKSSKNNGNFVCSYLRTMILNHISINSELLKVLKEADVTFSKSQLTFLLSETLKTMVNSPSEDCSIYTHLLKFIAKENKEIFLDTLKQLDMSLENLEMMVQSTLLDVGLQNQVEDQDEVVIDIVEVAQEDINSDLKQKFEENKSSIDSFLFSSDKIDDIFHSLQSLYLKSMLNTSTELFLSTCFKNIGSQISFLLRVATSNSPIKARNYSMKQLSALIHQLPKDTIVCSILPIILTLFISPLPQIRKNAGSILKAIAENPAPSSAAIILLADNIYGPKNSSNVAMLSPKDTTTLVNKLVENIPNLIVDGSFLDKCLQTLLSDKKLGKVYLAFFTTHALFNDIPIIKMDLMSITSASSLAVKGAASPSQLFEEFLANYLNDRTEWSKKCVTTGCDFQKFESRIVSLINPKEKNETVIKFLDSSLSSPYQQLVDLVEKKIVQILPSLKFSFQFKILNKVIEEGLQDTSTLVLYDPIEVLESVAMSSELFVELFKQCTISTTDSQQQGNLPKRRRRSSQSTRQAMKEDEVSNMASNHLKKVTLLLEVLDKFSNVADFKPSFELLKLLFTVLDDLETLGKDGKLPILYAQETIASCLKNVIVKLKESKAVIKDTASIRADVVVSAIRASDSPQVQNKLLLVVASLASLSPELVLHSVMPIFTFMGAHTIRQDDEFSGHVVEQTIICVVPALANAAQSGMFDEIEFLLASFVSAFLHVPRHRRVRLFTTLARTLGGSLSVYLILFLCGQQYVQAYMKHKMGDCAALVDFATIFLQNFKPKEELEATRNFLDLWKLIPEDVVEKDSPVFKKLSARVIFGPSIVSMNKSELYSLRKGMVSFIRHALVDNKSAAGISKLRLKIASQILQGNDTEEVLDAFSELTKYLLEIIGESNNNSEDDEILNKFYKLLGDVLSLLPIEYYVKSVDSILKSKNTSMKTIKNVVVLTSAKFKLEHVADPYAYEGITALMPTLLQKVSSEVDVDLSQACLDTLAGLFQRFSENIDSSLLLKTLTVATSKAGLLYTGSPELVISSINCITSAISVLGVKMIGLFPKIVPPLFKIFDKSIENDEESSQLIQIAILVLFSTLIKKIPNFLTPNIKDMLRVLFKANSISDSIRNTVLDVVVEYVDSKVVLTSLCSLWAFVSTLDAASLGLFLAALENTIENMSKKIAVSEASLFFRFLLNSLEYRATSSFDNNTISRVEASIHNCGIQYVMKLNDKTFRPLFASVVRWAFNGEDVITEINEVDRLQSFFKFFNKLQESLKSIITTYYTYILDSVEALLSRFPSGELVNVSLRRLIFISLTSSFKYDQVEYWQASTRYNSISKALTDQLVNVEDTIGKHLVKTLCSLAQDTSSSDEHNKELNEMLMSHMRAGCNAKEKYWAVKSLKTIYKKVGESWLSLLPQLVPTIAELLEDDDEEVEMEVRTGLAKVLEEVMGEPLDRYLE